MAATAGFFALAIVGTAMGVPPFLCAVRAVIGAVALFAIVMVAGRLVLTVVVDAFVGHVSHVQDTRKDPHEH
jgi:hypothetical protein